MNLNQPDRAALATFLLESLEPEGSFSEGELEKAWYDEAERRVIAFQEGRAEAMSLDEAIAEVSRAYL
jgi:putative addiction module component (TIGR02574 family)